MLIGGLQKLTLLDFPGKVAASIFTVGCNFACRFCYNPHLVLPEIIKTTPLINGNEVLDFLVKRQKYLDGVCLSGGEPTSQLDLAEFCQKLKRLGYLVKLDTNGLKPEMLKKLISQKLVDYVAMDIKAPLAKYAKIVGRKIDVKKIKASIKLLLAWQKQNKNLVVEFRSTLVPGLHTQKDVKQMAKLVNGAPQYFLQNFICPGMLVDKDFQPLQSFTIKEMEKFCQVAKKHVKNCEIRLNV